MENQSYEFRPDKAGRNLYGTEDPEVCEKYLDQDDTDRNDPARFEVLQGGLRTGPPHVWPHDNGYQIELDEIGTSNLRNMLKDGRLCPETITFREYYSYPEVFPIPEVLPMEESVAAMAREIFEDTDLAIVSLRIHSTLGPAAEGILGLSPQHQGEGVGFSILCSAELCLLSDATLYWLEKLFYHAPILENLKLHVDKEWGHEEDLILSTGPPIPRLKCLDICGSMPAQAILKILGNSKLSLSGVSFRAELSHGTWRELLSTIARDFPSLALFNLMFLREGRYRDPLRFRSLSREIFDVENMMFHSTRRSLRSAPEGRDADGYKPGLEIIEKGPDGNTRIVWVRYKGPDAGKVLRTVAASLGRPETF
jgi:hypothetical protein